MGGREGGKKLAGRQFKKEGICYAEKRGVFKKEGGWVGREGAIYEAAPVMVV